jgi:hypothetical protein
MPAVAPLSNISSVPPPLCQGTYAKPPPRSSVEREPSRSRELPGPTQSRLAETLSATRLSTTDLRDDREV